MKKASHKLISALLTAVIVVGLLPILGLPVSAIDVNTYTDLQSAAATGTGDIRLTGNITGATQLLIARTLTLDLNGHELKIELNAATGAAANGIKIATGVKLTITDGSSPSTGKLTVINKTISGTTDGNGAAINTSDGTLVIQSGTVEATGGYYGAGIGGGRYGDDGGTITISGGTVKAKGGDDSAGIGGGNQGAGGTITINGGEVTATGGGYGAGIGGGGSNTGIGGASGDILIYGENTVVKATRGTDTTNDIGAGTGSGGTGATDNIFVALPFGNLTLTNNTPAPNTVTFSAKPASAGTVTAEFPAGTFAGIDILAGLTAPKTFSVIAQGGITDVGFKLSGYPDVPKTAAQLAAAGATVEFVILSAPTAPQNLAAVAGNGQVALSWAAPASDGNSAITGYQVSSDGGATWTAASGHTAHTFTGLSNGTTYTFAVRAVNAAGPGASATTTATPAGVPGTQTYTITFDANGGSVTPGSAVTGTDGKLASLPTPTQSGYTFDGWYTATGAQVTTNYAFTADATIQARWTYTGGSNPGGYTGGGGYTGSGDIGGGATYTEAFITQNTAKFDKNGGKDIAVTFVKGNYELRGLTCGGQTLKEGTDYTVDGMTYTIKAEYLANLPVGKHTITFAMSGGTNPTLTVTVKDTTPEDEPEPEPEPDIVLPFADVNEKDWYYEAVKYIYGKGLMVGTAADTFAPEATLTRAMLVTVLYRLEGEPSVAGLENPFGDVPESEWYTDAVVWAAANGIVLGYGEGRFGPGNAITKEQLAAIIHRTQQAKGGLPPDTVAGHEWTDWDEVSEWAKASVAALTAQGLFLDIPGEAFGPQTPATRAEIASVLYRYLSAVK